jgi:hypothetical protein
MIAHEFEHIIEQLDDVDLARKARRAQSGVRAIVLIIHERSAFGHFRQTDPDRAGSPLRGGLWLQANSSSNLIQE